MWSDPLHREMLTAEQQQKLVMREGFGPNLRRGTGHVFNEDALEIFLAKNGLSHVVRAHEVQQAGFQVGKTIVKNTIIVLLLELDILN